MCTFGYRNTDMANGNGTASIRITLATYNSLKKLAQEQGYTIAGFADRAIMDKIETYIKNKSKSK